MTLSRRQFIGFAGGVAGSAVLGGAVVFAGQDDRGGGLALPTTGTEAATAVPVPTAAAAPTPVVNAARGRVLVVVQMAGGNDGLNTLVPTDSGIYRSARPNLAVAESDLLMLAGNADYALHPSLEPLLGLWDQGQLAAFHAIGMPGQTRSHFVALDTWWAGGSDLVSAGGWLGRWLDATADTEANPMRAITLGGGSPALRGVSSSPIIVQTLSGFALNGPTGSDSAAEAFRSMAEPTAEGLLGAAQTAIPVAVDAVDKLQSAFDADDVANAGNAGNAGNVGNAFGPQRPAELFDAAAGIIEADLGTEVIVINLGGFDTHAGQVGRHTGLLGNVGQGVAGLFDRLGASGHADQTLLMTYSEFGRRVTENASGGTDHGNGGLAMLMGPAVAASTVVGDVDLGNLDEGDVRTSVDSRSLYANALDWLGGPTAEVLGGDWDTYATLNT